MPDKVLIYSRFPKALMLRIGERFELMDAAGKPPREVFSADQLAGVRAMITAGGTPLAGAMMDAMPSWARSSATAPAMTASISPPRPSAGSPSATVRAANAASVADIAVTLMLAVTRRLLPADNYVRSGDWAAAKPSPLMRPQPGNPGRKVGVYGMGEIGRKIAARRRRVRERGGLFQPQPARRALSISAEPGGAGGMVQRADDRGSRRRRHPSRRRCRYPAKARQGRLRRQHLARLGDRPERRWSRRSPTRRSPAPASTSMTGSRTRRMR